MNTEKKAADPTNADQVAERNRQVFDKEHHQPDKTVLQAHEDALKDMEEDAEFTASSPNDDLDEGESARLGDEGAGVV